LKGSPNTRANEPSYVLTSAGVLAIILYGSLYPFQFHSNPEANGSLRVLFQTWHAPIHRGDFLANLLLYFPFGFFSAQALRELPKLLRIALVTCGGLALSVSMELAQFYDAGRVSALPDVYADISGAFSGAAVAAILFRKQPIWRSDTIIRRPFILLLLSCSLGYRLFPYVPTIDLHKYWTAVRPLVLSPTLQPLDLYEHTVTWLVLAMLLEALLGVAKSRKAIVLLTVIVLFAKVLIVDAVLSPAEVVGGGLAVLAWNAFLSRSRIRTPILAASFALVVIVQALEPFEFHVPARSFGWIPFRSFMQGSVEVNIRSFLEKSFTYGALVWLTARAGCKWIFAVGLSGGLVLSLRLIEVFLPGRSAEITDLIMLLILAAAMKLMGEDAVHSPSPNTGVIWWHSSLLRLYESLTRNDAVQPVDLIFVMAGRMERKPYGLELFRAGFEPQLVLSVGRFEVSKMRILDPEQDRELRALRDRTPPDERYFFVRMNSSGTRIQKARLPRCSTYGEALALRQFLKSEKAKKIMVISTDVHLRRVYSTFESVFRNAPVNFIFCPVPSRFGFLAKDGWWSRPDDRRFVVKELLKLAGYRVIMSAPAWLTRRLMRVKQIAGSAIAEAGQA